MPGSRLRQRRSVEVFWRAGVADAEVLAGKSVFLDLPHFYPMPQPLGLAFLRRHIHALISGNDQ
jgi:hypothetical protein